MAEISTEENEKIVARVYEKAMTALHNNEPITPAQRIVHDVEHMMQEVNSGASYEQYFRWASVDEIRSVSQYFRTLGLDTVAQITGEAIKAAFPRGMPSSEEEKSDATEWSSEQEEVLSDLFGQLEEHNGHVTNVLGAYAKRVGA